MRIVIATPLYPPDIALPAPYVKELARRLAYTHDVTVVAYGRYPEAIPGVRILVASKRYPLPIRLVAFFQLLLRAAKDADALIIENGPSVELPASVLALLTPIRLVMHVGDRDAHERARVSEMLGRIERFAQDRAHAVISDLPEPAPEILPFDEPSLGSFKGYEASWEAHLARIETALAHG
ncbi:MAG: glycosyltransferase [Patescibacteria group bacterium]